MSVSLSIKDVSHELAEALRERARRNHRSVQGELMAMLEAHLGGRFRAHDLLQDVRRLGVATSADATETLRREREQR